jgi:uncharacterized membrane protein
MSRHVPYRSAPQAGQSFTPHLLLAAFVGAVGGLAATTVALHSLEAGILGAVAGALAGMVGTLVKFERPDV